MTESQIVQLKFQLRGGNNCLTFNFISGQIIIFGIFSFFCQVVTFSKQMLGIISSSSSSWIFLLKCAKLKKQLGCSKLFSQSLFFSDIKRLPESMERIDKSAFKWLQLWSLKRLNPFLKRKINIFSWADIALKLAGLNSQDLQVRISYFGDQSGFF